MQEKVKTRSERSKRSNFQKCCKLPETCGESIFHWKNHSKPWFQHLITFSSKMHEDLDFFRLMLKFSKSRAVYNEKAIKCCKNHFKPVFRMKYWFSTCFRTFPTNFEIWPFWPSWPDFDLTIPFRTFDECLIHLNPFNYVI